MKILLAEPTGFSARAIEILADLGEVVLRSSDHSEYLGQCGDAEVLFVRLGQQIDDRFLNQAPQVKTIVSPTTGLDHIDLAAAKIRGIKIISLKGETDFLTNLSATAEMTWGLLLSLVRHIPQAHDHVLAGHWDRDLFKGQDLRGRVLGILGYGRLGRIVARYGLAFGMQVLTHDTREVSAEPGVSIVDMRSLLSESHIVTLHVPLESSTERLINAAALSCMREGSYLVNTSRGRIVDEAALLEALQAKHIAGAAVDVLDGEQQGKLTMIDHPIVKFARSGGNVILTPHIGGATQDAMARTEILLAERLKKSFQSG